MQYYEVSADILEDPEVLGDWVEKALAVARRARRKPKRR
jgi:TfoX/Sxy family transcriptional regulator of competence genes